MAALPQTLDELNALVQSQVDAILRQRGGAAFTPDYADLIEKHDAQIQGMLADRSLGKIMNGPTWISGTSVVNGTITAPKISVSDLEAINTSTGSLNITGTMIAAASFPATGARVQISSAGLAAYNSGVTQTAKIGTDGSGFLGVGGTAITWNTSGVVTIPTAAISSLTIAAIGGGVLGGTYQTATTGAHINLSTTGIVAYNATSEISANKTFELLASTGAMTATGSFTIQSASSGARVVIDNAGGIVGYNSGGTETFKVNAATGAGWLGGTGSGTNGISWNSSGTVSIGGASFSGGKITASSLSISSLSAISANLGTITAGSIDASSVTISNLSASVITAGTIVADRISGGTVGGSFSLGSASVTVNSTGTITNSDGDTWGPNGITLVSAGSFGDAIKWKVSGVDKGSIYSTSVALSLVYDPTRLSYVTLSSNQVLIGTDAGTNLYVDSTGIRAQANFYPGTTSGLQSARHISDNGSNILMTTSTLHITGAGGTAGLRFDNIGNGGSAGNWSSWGGATGAAYFLINIGGTVYRVPFLANA